MGIKLKSYQNLKFEFIIQNLDFQGVLILNLVFSCESNQNQIKICNLNQEFIIQDLDFLEVFILNLEFSCESNQNLKFEPRVYHSGFRFSRSVDVKFGVFM